MGVLYRGWGSGGVGEEKLQLTPVQTRLIASLPLTPVQTRLIASLPLTIDYAS